MAGKATSLFYNGCMLLKLGLNVFKKSEQNIFSQEGIELA